MEQRTQTTSPRSRTPELVRPNEGRIVAGVAKGLSDRLDITLWVVRGAFIVFALLGGLGLALYGAGWLLIRSEDEPESVAGRLLSDLTSVRSWIGIGLIVVAAMVVLDTVTFFDGGVLFAVGLLVVGVLLYTGQIPGRGAEGGTRSASAVTPDQTPATEPLPPATDAGEEEGAPPPQAGAEEIPASPPPPREKSILGRLTLGAMLVAAGILAVLDNLAALPIDAGPRHYLALGVIIMGLGLIVGAFAGRARWLILVGAVLLPVLVLSPVFEYDWNSEEFEMFVSPEEFDELGQEYEIEVGNLVIDLTDLPWNGETIKLVARVDAGNIEIFIPEDVGIFGEARVDIGRVATRGRTSAGLGKPTLEFSEDGLVGAVMLDAIVDIGNIDIHRRP